MKNNNLWLALLVTVNFLLVINPIFATAPSEQNFDDIDRMLDQQFKQKTADIDSLYHAYEKAIDDAYKGVTKKIKVQWPKSVKLPTKSTWVGYSKNLQTRTIVNFEEGTLVIESKVENNNLNLAKQEINVMAEQISSSTTASIEKLDILSQSFKEKLGQQGIKPKHKKTAKNNILKQLLPKVEVLKVTNAKVSELALVTTIVTQKNLHPSSKVLVTTQENTVVAINSLAKPHSLVDKKTESKEEKLASSNPQIKLELIEKPHHSVLKMTVKFVNNYQKVLLANNFDDVKRFSIKYDVPISVILAIIETESSYNPRAISRVPAFGLMQLVPKTAGVDAHHYVYGKKKIVSPDYLFDETNNLQLGTAYFKLLKSRYLRKIKDPRSRFYCAVSSYNTGVGNLAKTFTGQKNLTKAAKKINTMTSQQVYQFLLTNLPAEETRNYLKKIVARRAKYLHFDNAIKEI